MRPISATGKQQGFTLLEILLVVFIIGLMVSVVSLSLPASKDKQLQQEAGRLQALLSLAQEQAIFQNRDYGLQLTERGYVFFLWAQEQWQPLPADSRLLPRELPEEIALQLSVEGLAVDLLPTARALPLTDSEPEPKPQILLLSDGQLSEFQLTFSTADLNASIELHGRFSGELKLTSGDDS